jgi:hypothetical protein
MSVQIEQKKLLLSIHFGAAFAVKVQSFLSFRSVAVQGF